MSKKEPILSKDFNTQAEVSIEAYKVIREKLKEKRFIACRS